MLGFITATAMQGEPQHGVLTLMGWSAYAFPMLVEIAASAWRMRPEEVEVHVVHNLPLVEGATEGFIPSHWPQPKFVPMAAWDPTSEKGVCMPGVMREPAVSTVWRAVEAHAGDRPIPWGVLVHASASVAPSAQLGPGVWVHPQATIASMARLGAGCCINRNASVGHHNVLGDFCRLNPGAHTAGHCVLESGVTMGMGAVCREGVRIGTGAQVGAGSVVLKDVAPGDVVAGIPAHPLVRKP
jgi:carbonic anhydrase/acetyltransferase-like protein (isoleucine patch superfamily)